VVAPRQRAGLRLSPMAAALLLLVALGVAAALVPPSREAIARFFGVEGSRIERLPDNSGTLLPPPQAVAGIATPVSVADATRRLGFEVALPQTGEALRQAYLVFYRNQGVAVLDYGSFELWQTQLNQGASFGKTVDSSALLQQVSVRGRPANWLSGNGHAVYYILPAGEVVQGSVRTVERNTLIWRTPHAFYRIETDLSLAEALRIAETLP